MAISSAVVKAEILSALLTFDFGGVVVGDALARLDTLASAIATAIDHFQVNHSVTTTVKGNVSAATPSTVGIFTGSGTGSVVGLVAGDALSGTGLAGEVMAVLESADYGADPLAPEARARLADIANAIALFADYVVVNATVSTTDAGAGTVVNYNGPATGTGSGSVS